MASSIASFIAWSCGPRWRASSIIASIEREAPVGFGQWLKSLFGGGKKKGKSAGPRIDIGKRFELMNRTGQGSMSKVWRARDKQLGRMVCLKLLDKAKTAHFEARFKGLQRPSEGVICAGLRHKNIVQTFEHGTTTEGEPFLVMEP